MFDSGSSCSNEECWETSAAGGSKIKIAESKISSQSSQVSTMQTTSNTSDKVEKFEIICKTDVINISLSDL